MKTKEEVNRTISDSEILGRELTKKLCEQNNWDFSESVGAYAPYDCFIDMDDNHCVGEIKIRNVKFIHKPTLHFEVKKYEKLKAASEEEDCDKIFYINWLGNQCFVFDITDKLISESELGTSFSNRVTAESRAIENKIEKEMYFLPKYKAKRYTLRNYDEIYDKIVKEHNLNL